MPGQRLLVLAVAIFAAAIGHISLDYLYTSHPLLIPVSDGHGHGPDYGSAEWRSSVTSTIHFRSMLGGAAIGLLTFAAVRCLCSRCHDDHAF